MNVQIISVPFVNQGTSLDDIAFIPHRSCDIVAIEKVYRAETGTPSNHRLTIKLDDQIVTGMDEVCVGDEVGKVYDWLSHAAGGANPPLHVPKGKKISLNTNFAGAGNTTFDVHFHVAYGRA